MLLVAAMNIEYIEQGKGDRGVGGGGGDDGGKGLVAGHLGEGLVELVGDGLELLLFVYQLICKRK